MLDNTIGNYKVMLATDSTKKDSGRYPRFWADTTKDRGSKRSNIDRWGHAQW